MGIEKKILGYKVGGDFTMSSAVTQVKPMILHFHAQQPLPALEDAGHPPAVDLIHHVLSPRQAELLAALGRIVGKQRDGDGEEERERGKKIFIWE